MESACALKRHQLTSYSFKRTSFWYFIASHISFLSSKRKGIYNLEAFIPVYEGVPHLVK